MKRQKKKNDRLPSLIQCTSRKKVKKNGTSRNALIFLCGLTTNRVIEHPVGDIFFTVLLGLVVVNGWEDLKGLNNNSVF